MRIKTLAPTVMVIGFLAACTSPQQPPPALGTSSSSPVIVPSAPSSSATAVPPEPMEATPSVEYVVAQACQAINDAHSWDDWVMYEPDGSTFAAREHRTWARYAQGDYQRAVQILESSGLFDAGSTLTGDPTVAVLWSDAIDLSTAANQLWFDARSWLEARSARNLTNWRYSYGHLIRLVESAPGPCRW